MELMRVGSLRYIVTIRICTYIHVVYIHTVDVRSSERKKKDFVYTAVRL